MVDSNNATAALADAVQKLGRARLAIDLAREISGPAIEQLRVANSAIETAANLLQEVVQALVLR